MTRCVAMAKTLSSVRLTIRGDKERQHRVGHDPDAAKEDQDGKADPEHHRVDAEVVAQSAGDASYDAIA